MFSKTLAISAAVLFFGTQVNAHAAIAPALGVKGAPARSDVQRPSTAKPCGTANLADVSTSTAVNAAADGSVSMEITDFNAGTDGSRAIKSASLDTSGTGASFKALPASAITKNGVANPTSVGTDQITIQMPAGTTCTGGKCLLSMTTDGGFGNCVVVAQGGAAGAAGNATAAAGAASNATAAAGAAANATAVAATGSNSTAAATNGTAAAGAAAGAAGAAGAAAAGKAAGKKAGKKGAKKGKKGGKKAAKKAAAGKRAVERRAVGSRAPRAYMAVEIADLE